jgi:hypothetical protein
MACIGMEISMAVHAPRGPDDLDQVDLVGRSQAEMKPWIARRLVTSASDAECHAATSPCDDDNLGAHGIAVRGPAL